MNREDLVKLGFKCYEHYTVMGSLHYDIGRNRKIIVGCVGTPNEVVYLIHEWGDTPEEQDLVCIHNWDYDGYLTMEKVMNILKVFGKHLGEK